MTAYDACVGEAQRAHRRSEIQHGFVNIRDTRADGNDCLQVVFADALFSNQSLGSDNKASIKTSRDHTPCDAADKAPSFYIDVCESEVFRPRRQANPKFSVHDTPSPKFSVNLHSDSTADGESKLAAYFILWKRRG